MTAAALFPIAWAGAAWAAEPQVVPLDDALRLARDHAGDLAVAAARLEQAEWGVAQARALLHPTVGVRGGYTRNNIEVELDVPTGPGVTRTVTILPDDQLDIGVEAQVPLFGPAAWANVQAAHAATASARAQRDATEGQVLLRVAEAYFAAAGAGEVVEARAHALAVAEAAAAESAVRAKAGTANPLEISRANLAVVRAEQALREAQTTRDRVERALGVLAGVDNALRPVEEGVALALPADPVRQERPELTALAHASAAAEARAASARWRWAPTVSGFGQASAFNYEGFSGLPYAWSAGVRASWVGWDGGLRQVAEQQALAEQRELDARREQLERAFDAEVLDAEAAERTRQAAVDAADRAVALATEALALVEVQHRAGVATQLDRLDAQDALVAAELARAQARFDFELSRIALARARGVFPDRGTR